MDPYLIQSLIVQGKLVSPLEIDTNSAYLPVGVYQPGNRKLASGNDAYPLYAIPLNSILSQEIVWGNITGNINDQLDLKLILDSKYDATNPSGFITSGEAAFTYQPILGYIPEDSANKNPDTTLSANSDDFYPTQKAVKTYADGLIVGLLDDRGNWDASTTLWPTTGGSGPGGTILKGDLWYVSVGGTLGGTPVVVGNSFRALVDNPVLNSDWSILNVGLGYIPENIANKGIPNGYAALDALGKVPTTQLPAFTNLFFQSVGFNATTIVRNNTYYFGRHVQRVASLNTIAQVAPLLIARTGTITRYTIYLSVGTATNGNYIIRNSINGGPYSVLATGLINTQTNGTIKVDVPCSVPVAAFDQIYFSFQLTSSTVTSSAMMLTMDLLIQ
jgi:hypothetical protein